MRKKNKTCLVCNQPTMGKMCRECYQRTPRENKAYRRQLMNLSRYTQYHRYSTKIKEVKTDETIQ